MSKHLCMGRIVRYRLDAEDVREIGSRSRPSFSLLGSEVPMIVTRVWTYTPGNVARVYRRINGIAFLNGEASTLWVIGAAFGTENGNWQWPPEAQQEQAEFLKAAAEADEAMRPRPVAVPWQAPPPKQYCQHPITTLEFDAHLGTGFLCGGCRLNVTALLQERVTSIAARRR